MPVVACTRQGKKGYKYGQKGHCYTYTDEKSRKKAKNLAYIQGAAIEANTGENELNKYNQCHGDRGRFCSSGGGGGGSSGGGGGAPALEEGEVWVTDEGEQLRTQDEVDAFWERMNTEAAAKELTIEEKRALQEYVGPDFAFINAYSRHPGGGNDAERETYLKKAAVLDKAFEHIPGLKGEEIVYRGFNPPREMMDQMVKGAVIEDKGFVSTTIDRNVAKNFGSTVMTIRVPKGAKVINVRDIIQDTTTEHEKEMLLPRGTKLQITHVRQEAGGFLGMGKKLSIEARVIQ